MIAHFNALRADQIIYDKENKFFLINSFIPLAPVLVLLLSKKKCSTASSCRCSGLTEVTLQHQTTELQHFLYQFNNQVYSAASVKDHHLILPKRTLRLASSSSYKFRPDTRSLLSEFTPPSVRFGYPHCLYNN